MLLLKKSHIIRPWISRAFTFYESRIKIKNRVLGFTHHCCAKEKIAAQLFIVALGTF